MPIALAYHFSHYLTALLVNGQYALVALSDPFALGWNLFGTAHMPVDAGIVMGSDAAWAIWNAQAAAIVGGHILAVLAAHLLAFRLHDTIRGSLAQPVPAGRPDDRLHGLRPLAAVDADGRLSHAEKPWPGRRRGNLACHARPLMI